MMSEIINSNEINCSLERMRLMAEVRHNRTSVVGDMPLGTHFCYFYETREDLLDTVTPYFKVGLENKEFCLWVVSEPLTEEDAWSVLRQRIPEFDRHLSGRNLEIFSGRDWYLEGGLFDPKRVATAWNEKLNQAIARGYIGMRVSGDAGGFEKKNSPHLCDYERQLNESVSNQLMTVMCTYPLATIGAVELLDVARTHQFSVAKRKGGWEVFEMPRIREPRDEINTLNQELERKLLERGKQLTAVIGNLSNEVIDREGVEEALDENQQQLRAILDHSPSIIFLKEPNGRYLDCNLPFERLCGRSRNEIIGKTDRELFSAQQAEQFYANDLKVLDAGTPLEFEETVLRPDGPRTSLISKFPLRDVNDRIYALGGIVTDITERKQAEEVLRESEERFRLMVEGVKDYAIFMLDPEGRVSSWNLSAERFKGYREDEILGEHCSRFYPAEDVARGKPEEQLKLAAAAGRVEDEGWRVRKDGTRFWANVVITALRNRENGNLIGFCKLTRDATEQHEAQAALARAFDEINVLKDRLHEENVVLREEIDQRSMFEEIIGSSRPVKSVLSRVAKVAPMDCTVLITGETGTGKELIARAIHKRSNRAGRAFVGFNCAGIPPSLIASELFGHEKGAFTGAQQRRLGRFELAEGGTIFLDEVGELPAETQIALLRVIQEREFERVGGSQPIATDVRVIAATNRDLQDAVAAGNFRLDLFYRLNVFPIEVPPLRERREDISMLLEYFIKRYADKAGKKMRSIDKRTVELFKAYHWPGNIRELQNVIERSVIVCESENFSVDPSWLSTAPVSPSSKSSTLAEKLHEQEIKIIESALAESKGRIAGRLGAAFKLGIPSSTLESRIKLLKIKKNRFKSG
jgi:PAS domain S-box-containing protein